MIHHDWLAAVVGLSLLTYLVRAVPFWFSGIHRLPPAVHRFLKLVPAAALGALILPDAFLHGPPAIAAATVAAAFLLALRGFNLTVVVIASLVLAWIGLALG
jgi:branched-subunit amino acid transport protein